MDVRREEPGGPVEEERRLYDVEYILFDAECQFI